MLLSFLRHGKAEPYATSDGKRVLTDEGKEQIKNLGNFLKSSGISFDLILTSPYLRALETAESIASALNLSDKLFTEKDLECGADLNNIKNLVRQYNDYERILFVGHAPDVAYISQDLLDTANAIKFKTGSFITLETNIPRTGSASLKLFIHSSQLKAH